MVSNARDHVHEISLYKSYNANWSALDGVHPRSPCVDRFPPRFEVELDGQAERRVPLASRSRTGAEWQRRCMTKVLCMDSIIVEERSIYLDLSEPFANLNRNFTTSADHRAQQRMSWRSLGVMSYGSI